MKGKEKFVFEKKYLFLIFALLIFSCSSESSKSDDDCIYVDPSALISGNGTASSPYNSWSNVTFETGKKYLQKRGTTAREQITIDASDNFGSPITIGAYGTGAIPIIIGSEIETGWTFENSFIYSKQMTLPSLGIVIEDEVVLKRLIWNTNVATTFSAASAGSYSFNPSDNKIYVWCSDNTDPDTHVMEVSRRYYGIHGTNSSYIKIENFQLRNISLHGIQFSDSSHIDVSDCEIRNIGGAHLGSGIYAGNGIEFGNKSSDCSVINTIVENIFDSGVSPQTYDSSQNAARFVYSGLTISKCGFAGIEIAVLYNGSSVNSSIDGVTISDSEIFDCGKGFSGIRYGNEGRGIKIKGDGGSLEVRNITINNVTIRDGESQGIAVEGRSLNITVKRCMVSGNKKDGIKASSTDRVNLSVSSSVITSNATGGSAYGISVNLTESASSLSLIHNTLYDNTACELAIFGYSGSGIKIMNNLFHSSASVPHIYSAVVFPSGSSITYNWFKEFNNMISYNSTSCNNIVNFQSVCSYALSNIAGSSPLMNSTTFRLSSTSSDCYHAGLSGTGITLDRLGRSFATPPTIGAFEY